MDMTCLSASVGFGLPLGTVAMITAIAMTRTKAAPTIVK
jgi:hypothetical protein